MPRYVTRQFDDDWWFDAAPQTMTVHEEEKFVDTGLLDANGHRLYRDDSIKMGFEPMPKGKKSKSQRLKDEAFHEVEHNPPARVKRTQRKKGAKAARKQKVAIALQKARKSGARIPKKSRT